jgi:hypothetical protein
MKRVTSVWLAAQTLALAGLSFDVPMLDGAGPHLRHAKPVTHGPKGKRSNAERNARKAARRARARAKR